MVYFNEPINTCGVQKLPGLSISLWEFIWGVKLVIILVSALFSCFLSGGKAYDYLLTCGMLFLAWLVIL